MPKVNKSSTFNKLFSKIRFEDQEMILEKIEGLVSEAENIDVKKMQPKQAGFYRLRAGNYRVIFEYATPKEISLLKIDNRDSIYLR